MSQLGVASRRQAETWISEGRVKINGNLVTEMGFMVDVETDVLLVDDKPVTAKKPPNVYWMLNKPDLCLSSHHGDGGKSTIYDLPSLASIPFKVNSVGRLDYRTEGLLLLSNDGEFIHKMTHPSSKVPRSYYALVHSKLESDQLRKIQKGMTLDDGQVEPINIQYAQGMNLGKSTGAWYYLTVHEGRNRLVRRIFDSFDKKVVKLVRCGFGNLRLPDNLKPGEYRQLEPSELAELRKGANKND